MSPKARAAVLSIVAYIAAIVIATLGTSAGAAPSRSITHDRAVAWHVVQTTFPAHARGQAWSITTCETGRTWYPFASGDAGEIGLFQIHPQHIGKRIPWKWRDTASWSGPIIHSRIIERRRLSQPYYNTRVAYILSGGGRNWSPWRNCL